MDDHVGPPEPGDPPEPGEALDPEGDDGDPPVEAETGDVEHEPRRYPSTIGGAFYLAVLVAAVTALAVTYSGDWRGGVRVLAGCLGAAGLMRLVLPQRDAGMLAVRHRVVDVLMLATVAGVLWWLAGSIPDQPVS